MSRTIRIPSHTRSSSSDALSNEQDVSEFQSPPHNGELQLNLTSPSTPSVGSSQPSSPGSPAQMKTLAESPIHDDPHLPRATATKRDKLVGKAERVVSKIIRDPELHEQGMLRTAGGKELADGLATIDSKDI